MMEMDAFDRINKQGIYAEDEADEYEGDLEEELEDAGLDYDELEDMDGEERRAAIEDAGLDPDDYDDEF